MTERAAIRDNGRSKCTAHLIFRWSLSFFCLALCQQLFAGSGAGAGNAKRPADYIDYMQQKIDLMDGKEDGKVDLHDSALTAYAGQVYFVLVDSIQKLIGNRVFDSNRQKNYRDNLYQQLQKVNASSVYDVKKFDNIFRFMAGELNAALQNRLYDFLKINITSSLNSLSFIRNEQGMDSFLVLAAYYRPDLVFSNYNLYAGKNYSLHVLEEASKIAPVTVKRYFNAGNPIYERLKTSNDTAVKIILRIKENYERKSNAYTLLDAIVNGEITIEKADAIGKEPEKYLLEMIKIRSKKNPLAVHSLESELAIYSLKFIRVLNDMHNDPDSKRFASIEQLSAREYYTLIVYSQEEIFTSTFNGLFKRMMVKAGEESGFDFLKDLGDNKFRTFIKMCAGFGKLEDFLKTMNPLQQQMLMAKFASGLEQYNDLSQAVEVADAFSSITDSLVLRILRSEIRYQYVKFKTTNNQRGQAIYGLLSNLFVEKKLGGSDWFSSVSSEYKLPPFDRLANNRLFGRDSIDRWLIYFYDDEDGDASFATFIKTFTDPNWIITDLGSYVIIKSKTGKPVNIYANKPKHEYDGQDSVEKIFAANNYEPNVMVHRGHSYYAYKTIEKVKDDTRIFVLGSCGGYHSISGIIDRSPEAAIISSKQIGTMYVNNPMLKLLADNINSGQDIEWQKLWDALEAKVKPNPRAYERFLDYIPPQKNLGAIFIKTYNKMMEEGS